MVHHLSKMRNKNCMIFSIVAEKAFGKIQHHSMSIIIYKIGAERTVYNTMRVI